MLKTTSIVETIVIFVPNTIIDQKPGFLLGFYDEDDKLRTKSVYIIDTQPFGEIHDKSNTNFSELIGSYSSRFGNSKFVSRNDAKDIWITISCNEFEVTVKSCLINKKPHNLNNCIVVVYDIKSFMKSELILIPLTKNFCEIDHFHVLAKSLQSRQENKSKSGSRTLRLIVNVVLSIFTFVHSILLHCPIAMKYSALALHLKNYTQSIVWFGETYKRKNFISLKSGNYLMSLVFDMIIGFLVYDAINKWKSADEMFDSLSYCTERVIDSINHIVLWLMGSPAGLKLNQPLSSLFGTLVMYYLEIWWTFLGLVRPILEIAFLILIKLGFLGLTFQLAVCSDVFALISFHIYCIYVYAARLYEIQAKGIYSLSRLVLGRKRNPEPGKIDSCPYSTEELLIGTISFAVLLFLLPTTLVYYIVFTMMRIGSIVISGLMTRTMYFMQTLPVYTTFLWLFFPYYTATTVKLTPVICSSKTEHGCLVAKSTNASWLETIKHCVPDAISSPQPVTIGNIMWKIMVGKFI